MSAVLSALRSMLLVTQSAPGDDRKVRSPLGVERFHTRSSMLGDSSSGR